MACEECKTIKQIHSDAGAVREGMRKRIAELEKAVARLEKGIACYAREELGGMCFENDKEAVDYICEYGEGDV